MKDKSLLDIPERFETERLYLRSYRRGDGSCLLAASRRNRQHLAEFETDNVILSITNEEQAEQLASELAAGWQARTSFFIGIFEKQSDDWIGQIYVGVSSWETHEFRIGYVVDIGHEGKGFITEAVGGALRFLFENLKAQRVCLECEDANVRSISVADRCGFVREGHASEGRKNPDGSFSGTCFYAMQKSDYQLDRT